MKKKNININYKKIGKRVKNKREDLKLTQDELADKANVSSKYISNTGRKAKNVEDVMIFSNGEPRELKLDAKKNLAVARENSLDVKGKSSYEVRDMLQENNLEIRIKRLN